MSGNVEVQDDDAFEGRPDPRRDGLVGGMRRVGGQAFAIHEVHGESLGQVFAPLRRSEVLSPVRIEQTRNLSRQIFDQPPDLRDLGGSGFRTRSQKQDVSDHRTDETRNRIPTHSRSFRISTFQDTMPTTRLDTVLAACDTSFPSVVEKLSDLVRIPSCSFSGYDPSQVEQSADAVAAWLREIGLPEVEVIRLPGVHPAVVARDHRAGTTQPTLLLYAHHDVQPPMRESVWDSPAFEPTVRDGRLYGRGAADDKAGIALHAASIAAWYAVEGKLPVNVTLLIEGEEETGSDHLAELLDTHLSGLRADAVVIADLANQDTGIPSLTVSLRGLVALEIELRGLERPLHSGVWGGPVPDTVTSLCKILASLTDSDGNIAVAGLLDGIEPATEAERTDWRSLPYDREHWARQAGIAPSLAPIDSEHLCELLWRRPALSINGIQAGTRGQVGNVLMDAAWARLGVRIVPGMDPIRVARLLEDHLRAATPKGMTLSVSTESSAPAWGTTTEHALFTASREALEIGYGAKPVAIGCGASIPFVGAITKRLGGAPALLVGVEDPWCNAHAENESVHLGDLLKAIRSQAAFFALAARS